MKIQIIIRKEKEKENKENKVGNHLKMESGYSFSLDIREQFNDT